MPDDLTPAHKYLKQIYQDAESDKRRWLKATSKRTCWCSLSGIAVVVTIVVGLSGFSAQTNIILIASFSAAIIAVITISELYTASKIIPMNRYIELFERHTECVLLDHGLLVMMLSAESDREISEYFLANSLIKYPAFPSALVDRQKSIIDRLQFLLNHYVMLCKYIRREPYPQIEPNTKPPLVTPAPEKLARMSMAIVLYRTLVTDGDTRMPDSMADPKEPNTDDPGPARD